MADKRIKDLAVTASSPSGDDFFILDSVADDTRKIAANYFAETNDLPPPTPSFFYEDDGTTQTTSFLVGDIPNSYALGNIDLKQINLGNSVAVVGINAFEGCIGLTQELILPNSVVTIGSYAFNSCEFNGELIIPNSVTIISNYAFYNCGNLTALTLGNSVTSIGDSAFRFCGNFQGDLVIPDSVVTVSPRAFRLAGFTGNLIIGSGVTSIGLNAFSVCGFTGYVMVPSSATVIGSGAFASCASLTTAYLNQPFAQVAADCFLSSGVTNVYIGPDATGWTLGSGQTIGGKSGITVSVWTNYPNIP